MDDKVIAEWLKLWNISWDQKRSEYVRIWLQNQIVKMLKCWRSEGNHDQTVIFELWSTRWKDSCKINETSWLEQRGFQWRRILPNPWSWWRFSLLNFKKLPLYDTFCWYPNTGSAKPGLISCWQLALAADGWVSGYIYIYIYIYRLWTSHISRKYILLPHAVRVLSIP